MVAQSGEENKIFHLSPSLFEGDGNSTKKDRKKCQTMQRMWIL